jgi:hypothetical protein
LNFAFSADPDPASRKNIADPDPQLKRKVREMHFAERHDGGKNFRTA